ncbi:SprA family protein [Candidatus Nitrotoga sp. BS]|uniref:putative metalloprotease CJM1_0395 family protein n=1 Tax=Candidatus Nitrotoga sp. BS TaxID=2890408 RepID=UPI001EF1A431|nr:putative metalloprotease CJM1_0395 family protein [Candidatus Nitrotoga sp. BS]CAH1210521.1 SprA family protein [Candidatus Nitrotoga sp. BS]
MITATSNQAFFTPQSRREVSQAARNEVKQTVALNDTQKPSQDDSTASQQNKLELQSQIQKLRDTDREVRSHEQAHLAAAGGISQGGASFKFILGPDGQRYAVSGEVQIDTSRVAGDPETTLQKAQQIQQAALAPSEPSAQDRSVAMAAAAMAAEARAEIMSRGANENKPTNNDQEETNFQRISSKINHTYNAISEINTERAASLIDLLA